MHILKKHTQQSGMVWTLPHLRLGAPLVGLMGRKYRWRLFFCCLGMRTSLVYTWSLSDCCNAPHISWEFATAIGEQPLPLPPSPHPCLHSEGPTSSDLSPLLCHGLRSQGLQRLGRKEIREDFYWVGRDSWQLSGGWEGFRQLEEREGNALGICTSPMSHTCR